MNFKSKSYIFIFFLAIVYYVFGSNTVVLAQKTTTGWVVAKDVPLTNQKDQVIATLQYKTSVNVLDASSNNKQVKIIISGWLHPDFSNEVEIISENQIKTPWRGADIFDKASWSGILIATVPANTVYNYTRKIINENDMFFLVQFEGYVDKNQITANYVDITNEDQRQAEESKLDEERRIKERDNAFVNLSGVYKDAAGKQMSFSRIMFDETMPSSGWYYPTKMINYAPFIVIKPSEQNTIEIKFKDIKRINFSQVPKEETGQGWAHVIMRSGKSFVGGLTGYGDGNVDIYLKVGEAEVKVELSYQMANCSIEFD